MSASLSDRGREIVDSASRLVTRLPGVDVLLLVAHLFFGLNQVPLQVTQATTVRNSIVTRQANLDAQVVALVEERLHPCTRRGDMSVHGERWLLRYGVARINMDLITKELVGHAIHLFLVGRSVA